ncbi:prenyltransferase/squalene oxidase repeat-containing protein [Tundrisphaera sp. TA3]|uniref:prenyltransferase/squalene oxidase repeat-containing protein n=1 Tax=Tundrisphaera sp. TA3 TaxID=3435775 RepID=UPI003EBF2324
MTGLNMESFLRLIRADLGAWSSLAVIAVVLALMTWTSWGSRRALWKCLVLSVAVHAGLLVYGNALAPLLGLTRIDGSGAKRPIEVVERVRIAPVPDDRSGATGAGGKRPRKVEAWDRDRTPLALDDPASRPPRPEPVQAAPAIEAPTVPEPLAAEPVVAEAMTPTPAAPEPAQAPAPVAAAEAAPDVAPLAAAEAVPDEASPPPRLAPEPAPGLAMAGGEDLRARTSRSAANPGRSPMGAGMVAGPSTRGPIVEPSEAPTLPAAVPPASGPERRPASVPAAPSLPLGPDLEPPMAPSESSAPAPPRVATNPAPMPALPEADLRRSTRPARGTPEPAPIVAPGRLQEARPPVAMARVTPSGPSSSLALPRPGGRRALSDVPTVYRSRLDPNRATLAQRAGASVASEQAVEKALEWLAKHQDADGRWDGGTARTRDGTALGDDDSFTSHCDPGDICYGECLYWEADTALTGLSLLAYLGAGYTHVDGKYAQTVDRGLDFLLRSQKEDGDLRGASTAVGMYCHAMATLALAEAHALTGDSRLREAAEKGVGFLVRSRASDGLAWRYTPGERPMGDTSILGWAVMALRTGRVIGVTIPASIQPGVQAWLKKVAGGTDGGLARYQPGTEVDPTMTAEAWACRQFLGFGGPGAASDEAAAYLLRNGPAKGPYNIYYWYYGTLAMFQRGGEDWKAWNGQVRDRIVARQETLGHKAGSWESDKTQHGSRGGRIYGTALATLTLEVYYRYLRLYEATPAVPATGPSRSVDAGARRAGSGIAPAGR